MDKYGYPSIYLSIYDKNTHSPAKKLIFCSLGPTIGHGPEMLDLAEYEVKTQNCVVHHLFFFPDATCYLGGTDMFG